MRPDPPAAGPGGAVPGGPHGRVAAAAADGQGRPARGGEPGQRAVGRDGAGDAEQVDVAAPGAGRGQVGAGVLASGDQYALGQRRRAGRVPSAVGGQPLHVLPGDAVVAALHRDPPVGQREERGDPGVGAAERGEPLVGAAVGRARTRPAHPVGGPEEHREAALVGPLGPAAGAVALTGGVEAAGTRGQGDDPAVRSVALRDLDEAPGASGVGGPPQLVLAVALHDESAAARGELYGPRAFGVRQGQRGPLPGDPVGGGPQQRLPLLGRAHGGEAGGGRGQGRDLVAVVEHGLVAGMVRPRAAVRAGPRGHAGRAAAERRPGPPARRDHPGDVAGRVRAVLGPDLGGPPLAAPVGRHQELPARPVDGLAADGHGDAAAHRHTADVLLVAVVQRGRHREDLLGPPGPRGGRDRGAAAGTAVADQVDAAADRHGEQCRDRHAGPHPRPEDPLRAGPRGRRRRVRPPELPAARRGGRPCVRCAVGGGGGCVCACACGGRGAWGRRA